MKHKPSALKMQRHTIDKKLAEVRNLASIGRPRSGWIKAIRESLGMTSTQLAQRLGIRQSSIIDLEQNEKLGKTTLETLEKAARALNCKLVYAIIPETSLEEMVDTQATRKARALTERVAHSMSLEKQNVSAGEVDVRATEIARELKEKMSSRMWDDT